jgi:type IV pilus assembly protein PilW
MSRHPVHSAPFIQRGMTLIELMISMLLGLIVVGGVLGIFVANSETHRRTDDLARIQENARVAVQFMSRSMREAGGNPCGIPLNKSLIVHTTAALENSWWSGGKDFTSSLRGYARGGDNLPATGFTANGSVPMVNGSDAFITVSGNSFVKTVIGDSPPNGVMLVSSNEGFFNNDILFACSTDRGRGVVFRAGAITRVGTQQRWQIARGETPFEGAVANMSSTALGKIHSEGWFIGRNGRQGTSLFRAFIGDGGVLREPEEIAPDVSGMTVIYLLPGENDYLPANQIADADWLNVIAAYIELTITRRVSSTQNIERTVGLTVNFRNKFDLDAGGSGEDGG